MIHNPSADDRPGSCRNSGGTRPHANRRAALFFTIDRADEGKTAGNKKSRADSLQGARRDQRARIGRKPAANRCEREDTDADHENAPPPEAVARRAADQEQCGHAQRVGIDHPLHRRERRVQIRFHAGQRDVDDGFVDEGHRRGKHGAHEHPAFLMSVGGCGRRVHAPYRTQLARLARRPRHPDAGRMPIVGGADFTGGTVYSGPPKF
jgi:hypothetical protein